ncbi:MAG: UvrD-helicase domain-containing protein, partial [Bacilli bacterium]|nr:UvrD-helicase domain-containing protein [Bacilli bacterium]
MEKNIPLFDLSSFKYHTNYALEASAGTGKTYSIKEMVKQLVLIHHLPLDKILIVTYTEKAAGELKDRIRDVLTSPLKELGGQSVKEVVGATINCDVDNAFIGTIHSFCKNTIKEFAFSINKPFNLALAESDMINQYANKFIREGNILEDITRLLDYPFIIKEDFLIKKFISLMEHYYLNDKGEEDPSIISYLPSYEDDPLDKSIGLKLLLSKAPIKELKALDINLYSDYELLKSSSHPNVIQFIEDFEDYAKFINSKDGVSKYKIEINKGCTRDEQAAYKHLFALKKEVQDFDQHNYLIDKYLKDFYLGYLKYKEDNRLQTFNDMLRIVRESVLEKDSKLLKCLKDKYTYAIIDEFQDTNQIQFDIFKEVFMSIDHHIIVVGDPKQSIYSYQGADVTVYQKAVELISKTGMKCRLGKNHRSYSGVVSFGNELFKHYPFASSFEPSLYRSIEQGDDSERRLIYKGQYSPALMMNETPLDPDSYAKFAITLILDFVDKPDGKNTSLQLVTVNKEGQEKMRNVTFLDFVVLGRSRSELAIMQTALKKAGIPALRYKDNTLFSGIECLQWISLLEAIDVVDFTGYNRGYFKKALFTKFFNLSIKEISDDKYDEDDNEPYRLLEGWRHLAKEGLWQDLFDRIIEESNIDKHMPELDQLQSLSAFKQLGNYCVDYLFEGHIIKELINNLIEVSDAARNDLDSSALIEKSTEFNAVRLMTMHASKGLQFPVVISMGGAKGLPPSADSYSCHHLLKSGDIGYVTSVNKLKEVNEETNGEST